MIAFAIPILGTGLVGAAVGALFALLGRARLTRGAVWGAVGGVTFGAVAMVLLRLSPG